MIEKEIDSYIIKRLQKNKIDFFRIQNQASKGKSRNYSSTAYDEPIQCHKYFPDISFPFDGRVRMIENGIKDGATVRHSDRKKNQRERMKYWADNGGCSMAVITSVDDAKEYMDVIGIPQ